MIQFGGLLHIGIIFWVTKNQLDWSTLAPTLRWQMVAKFLVAVVIMLIKGAQLSREEHIYITLTKLSFVIGTQELGQIATPRIKTLLFLKQPVPSLLVLADNSNIGIREL